MTALERRGRVRGVGSIVDAQTPRPKDIAVHVPEKLEDTRHVSELEARELFGHMFIGSREVMATYGIVGERVPAIPFPKKVLEKAQKLGYRLVLQTNRMKLNEGDDIGSIELERLSFAKKFKLKVTYNLSEGFGKQKPFSAPQRDVFIDTKSPRQGWRLVSNSPAKVLLSPGTIVEQLEALVERLRDLYEDVSFPRVVQQELDEFDRLRPALQKDTHEELPHYGQRVAELLSSCSIFRRVFEDPVETVYRFLIDREGGSHDSFHIDRSIRTSILTASGTSGRQFRNMVISKCDFYKDKKRMNIIKMEPMGMIFDSGAYVIPTFFIEPLIDGVEPEL